jgi:hypothetical protein
VDSVEAAVERITRFYRRYHSMRYASGKLVLRMTEALPPGRVEELRRLFADVLPPGGGMTQTAALPAEADEPDVADLPRLVVDFNRTDFGRLRSLVDAVNAS